MLRLVFTAALAWVAGIAVAKACDTTDAASYGSATMILNSGETCALVVGVGTARFGTGSGVNVRQNIMNKGVRIVERPAHGQAGVAGLNSVAYASKAGYHGPDRIRADVEMNQNGVDVTRTITIVIEVR